MREMPLAGVRIELIDSLGSVIASTLTDAQGQYRFEGLPAGSYSVRQIQPAGYFHGGQRAGSGGGNDSLDDLISTIIVQPGSSLVDYDFREIPPSSLSGSVFVDLNGNSIRDQGEPPIAGVTLTLVNSAGAVVGTAQTDAQGNYSFTGLRGATTRFGRPSLPGFHQGGQRAGFGRR